MHINRIYIYIHMHTHTVLRICKYVYIYILECRLHSWLEMLWLGDISMAPFPLGHQIGNNWNQQPLNRKNCGSPSNDSGMNHDNHGLEEYAILSISNELQHI